MGRTRGICTLAGLALVMLCWPVSGSAVWYCYLTAILPSQPGAVSVNYSYTMDGTATGSLDYLGAPYDQSIYSDINGDGYGEPPAGTVTGGGSFTYILWTVANQSSPVTVYWNSRFRAVNWMTQQLETKWTDPLGAYTS